MFSFFDLLNFNNVCLLQKLGCIINYDFKIRSDNCISVIMYYFVHLFCYLLFVYANIVKLPHMSMTFWYLYSIKNQKLISECFNILKQDMFKSVLHINKFSNCSTQNPELL